MLTSFFIFFGLFTLLGVAAGFWSKKNVTDYLLASRDIPAWMVGLSFGATISSGATFIGFAGLAYHSGITAIYTVAGLMIGDYIGWRIAGNKIRQVSCEKKLHTYSSLIGKLGDREMPKITFISSILTVIFMGTYCAAQLVAGAKVGAALFDWNFTAFVLIGAGVLLAYCWAGGIRASIWTDAAQALIILFSLLVLIVAGLAKIGGFEEMWAQLTAIDPSLTNPFQVTLLSAAAGWFFFGIGILGQPQLMVRHMVARCDADITAARRIYMGWRIAVLALAVLSGLIGRILIPTTEVFDPELSIPLLWQDLLPPVLVGLLIAGLFSATMSTADSLLLSASSAMTQHIIPQFAPQWRNSYFFARLGTVVIIALIVVIAMMATKGVLSLVIIAWAGMSSAIVPFVILQLLGFRVTQKQALIMMVSGFGVMALWRYGLGWHTVLLDLVPGMMTGFAVYGLLKAFELIKPKEIARAKV